MAAYGCVGMCEVTLLRMEPRARRWVPFLTLCCSSALCLCPGDLVSWVPTFIGFWKDRLGVFG